MEGGRRRALHKEVAGGLGVASIRTRTNQVLQSGRHGNRDLPGNNAAATATANASLFQPGGREVLRWYSLLVKVKTSS